ncbi:MAG: IgGFc-binding protein [Myxococcota bacterium]
MRTRLLLLLSLGAAAFAGGCSDPIDIGRIDGGPGGGDAGTDFICVEETDTACSTDGTIAFTCERSGEFLSRVATNCRDELPGGLCIDGVGCALCDPGDPETSRPPERTCCTEALAAAGFCERGERVLECGTDGGSFVEIEECDVEAGFACEDAVCVSLCERAIMNRSYEGCEFFAVDLDNAAPLGSTLDASFQQYAVVLSNPSPLTATVTVEVNDAAPGEPAQLRVIETRRVPPGAVEEVPLDRREIDGSSSRQRCVVGSGGCPRSEECVALGSGLPGSAGECRLASDLNGCSFVGQRGRALDPVTSLFTECRFGQECVDVDDDPSEQDLRCVATGRNDGTGSALTSQAYRLTSNIPIIAYQFNPFTNASVFSNDASLLLPTSAIGSEYTVVGWPQTIADADCLPGDTFCEDTDFLSGRKDEDLRSTLTVVGTRDGTMVDVTLGNLASQVLGLPDIGRPVLTRGDTVSVTLDAFDVLNLETDLLNSDFTGTRVSATAPVSVFSGSEASDAPRFNRYPQRQCCADHLEEQLFSNETLGREFFVARMPPRTVALNEAFTNPEVVSVPEVNEVEYVRVVAVSSGETRVSTTLFGTTEQEFTLFQGENRILAVERDFQMEASEPIAVLQVLPSQEAVGISSELNGTRLPGGDPAILALPPVQQFRQEYVFLTPRLYAFDFVVITGDADAEILLDGVDVKDPSLGCEIANADGVIRMMGEAPDEELIFRCQLSFPDVEASCTGGDEECDASVMDGRQQDGVHTVTTNDIDGVGVVVYGFDAFVSYAYAAGLDLEALQ